jgi:flagellar basal body-associated protein FliL
MFDIIIMPLIIIFALAGLVAIIPFLPSEPKAEEGE